MWLSDAALRALCPPSACCADSKEHWATPGFPSCTQNWDQCSLLQGFSPVFCLDYNIFRGINPVIESYLKCSELGLRSFHPLQSITPVKRQEDLKDLRFATAEKPARIPVVKIIDPVLSYRIYRNGLVTSLDPQQTDQQLYYSFLCVHRRCVQPWWRRTCRRRWRWCSAAPMSCAPRAIRRSPPRTSWPNAPPRGYRWSSCTRPNLRVRNHRSRT